MMITGSGLAITVRLHDEEEFHELTAPRRRFQEPRGAILAATLLMDYLDPSDYAIVRVEGADEVLEAEWLSVNNGRHDVWRLD